MAAKRRTLPIVFNNSPLSRGGYFVSGDLKSSVYARRKQNGRRETKVCFSQVLSWVKKLIKQTNQRTVFPNRTRKHQPTQPHAFAVKLILF